jgi:hypothetical protein
MRAIVRLLGLWIPRLGAAARVADTTADVLTQTHTLLATLDVALKDGQDDWIDPEEIRVLRQEGARLLAQIEVVTSVFRDLYDD